MSDGEIVGTAIAVLAPIGGAVAFIWSKIEARFAAIEKKLAECQEREDASQERRGVLVAVAELLWQELKRVSPRSAALTRARLLLDQVRELPGLD